MVYHQPRIAVTIIGLVVTLSACATAHMHTEAELGDVTRVCGLNAGELVQDSEDPRILFLIHPNASPRQRICAVRWAKRNHLHLAYVEGIELKEK